MTTNHHSPTGGSFAMRPRCAAHAAVCLVAVLAWVASLYLMWVEPGPNEVMRLPYFALIGTAVSASSLAAFPLVMRGFVRDVVLAYVAGRYDERAAVEEERRPLLEVVR